MGSVQRRRGLRAVLIGVLVIGSIFLAPVAYAADTEPPDTVVSQPQPGGSLPAGQVTITGQATDNIAVATVEVAIRDRTADLWLRADGTWGSFTWLDTSLATPGTPTTTWSYTFNATTGPHTIGARTRDTSGNLDPSPPWVRFDITGTSPDTEPPDTVVSQPQPGGSLPAGQVTITGQATDNIAVATVEVAIRDRTADLWLRADGTWGSFTWLDTSLATPGTPTTTWSYTFNATTGPHTIGARTRDTSGNLDPTRPWVRFDITGTSPDTEPPDTVVSQPQPGASLPAGQVTITGQATDNIAVATVEVAIRDRTADLWLRADGTWGSFTWLDTSLATPGTPTTTWSYTFNATTGPHTIGARTRDTSGNLDPTRPWVRFDITSVGERKPDVVVVLTDDQRWDTLWAMPNVNALLVEQGVNFTNGFVVNALCCPSRATIFKGAYSHSTGVYQNSGSYGPFSTFDDTSTVATWLDAAGYRTSFVGKYFNGYTQQRSTYVPPGWDRWVAFATDDVGGGHYYDYNLSVDGALRWHGSAAEDYSTDVLAEEATSFIRSTPADESLFVYFAPYGPHEPATPAPRHSSAFPNLSPWRPPNYNEADVSDKPGYIQNLPSLPSGSTWRIDNLRRRQLQSLLSIDDAVADLVQSLEDTGRLSNTMFVFTSDNGFAWGEHRWGAVGAQNKQVPYEESVRVPYVVRYDPLTQTARTDTRFALTIDLAPTFAELAGVAAPGTEGSSLLPALGPTPPAGRADFLVEHHVTNVPSYCAVRTTDRIYVQYATGEEELYALDTDPYQLVNRATDPTLATTLATLRARAHTLCTPPPPGFVFSH